jgi:tetratricopeptide (TPR) repeat protein
MKESHVLAYSNQFDILKMIDLAQNLQYCKDYIESGKAYQKILDKFSNHPYRIKALFEIADNQFYRKEYVQAIEKYKIFIIYCTDINNPNNEERNLIEAYLPLAKQRINNCKKMGILKKEEI